MLGQITYLSYNIAITDVIATSEAAREALTVQKSQNQNKSHKGKFSAAFDSWIARRTFRKITKYTSLS
jgi:hypothetical protein